MKYLFFFLITACASRFENFDTIKPGMTKTELREEMTLVQGILNFPPYEFRSYPQGLVVLKDNDVVESFGSNSELSLDVKCTTKVTGKHANYRYFIRPAVGLDSFEKALFLDAQNKLKLLLRVMGHTIVDDEAKAKAVIIMELATTPHNDKEFNHRFSMSAVTPEKGSVWRVNAEVVTENKELVNLIPSLIAAASEFILIPLRDPKTQEVNRTNVANRIMRNADGIDAILSKDPTLSKKL